MFLAFSDITYYVQLHNAIKTCLMKTALFGQHLLNSQMPALVQVPLSPISRDKECFKCEGGEPLKYELEPSSCEEA